MAHSKKEEVIFSLAIVAVSIVIVFGGIGAVFFIGNRYNKEVSRVSVGAITDVTPISSGVLEDNKMQVKCEKAVVVILGQHMIPLGEEAHIVKLRSNQKRISWEFNGRTYRYVIE